MLILMGRMSSKWKDSFKRDNLSPSYHMEKSILLRHFVHELLAIAG